MLDFDTFSFSLLCTLTNLDLMVNQIILLIGSMKCQVAGEATDQKKFHVRYYGLETKIFSVYVSRYLHHGCYFHLHAAIVRLE